MSCFFGDVSGNFTGDDGTMGAYVFLYYISIFVLPDFKQNYQKSYNISSNGARFFNGFFIVLSCVYQFEYDCAAA